MSPSTPWLDYEHIRIRMVMAAMLATFVFLGTFMWWFQVARGHQFEYDLEKQSVRRVRLPGLRGRIFDRNDICLADNRPSYGIALYLEEIRQRGRRTRMADQVETIVQQLSETLRLEPSLTRDEINAHIRRRLPLPLVAWRDIDEATLARFSEQAALFPGVDIVVDAQRIYPLGPMACHVIGYVGRAEPVQDEEAPYHFILPEPAGHAGLERRYDGVLRGQSGGRLVRVDVAGFRHEDLADQSPRPGHDVVITLDMRIQRLADELARPAPAAIVVIDPRNGDVLAMASSPTFNPNDFVPSIPAGRWQALLADPGKPLVNKAILGEYPPGSTFKPVVAIAALENKLASAQTSYECPGYLDLGRTRFRCWTQGRHGLLNMRQAIEHSCNVYFFRLGMQIGEKYIEHMASAIGLGRPTGISLDPEAAGLVPNEAWMRRQFGHGWRMGDTCNLSIGQGALLVTPLQMAMLASVLANGGHVYRPRLVSAVRAADGRLVERFAPEMVNELNWSPAHADVVRGGMRDVIMSPHGTGKLAAIPTVAFAGKTGTAEFGRKGEGRKHAWMIAFAPYEQPRYAVAVMVEEGVSGGVTAAPIMKRLLTGLFPAVGAEGEG